MPSGRRSNNICVAGLRGGDYSEVKTPQLMDAKQWEQSGHWGKYRENMFVVPDEIPNVDDDAPVVSGAADMMALKPMKLPGPCADFPPRHQKLPRSADPACRDGMLPPQ